MYLQNLSTINIVLKKLLDWYSEIKTPEQKFDDVFWGDDY